MRAENANSLERLSLYSHLCGLVSVFIGLAVTLMDLFKGDMTHIMVGFYIFITGYAAVKIAAKLSYIVISER